MQVGVWAPTQRISKRNSTGNASWGVGPQHREFRKRNSTGNASWGVGPNKEELDSQFLQTMQVGLGQRNKFCENIISVPLPRLFWIMLHHLNDFRQFL